ncbi:MAG: hypothetical protein AB7U23_12500 [Dehalococcoidia bacterium]
MAETSKRDKAEAYGFIQSFLDANPEIKRLVNEAIKKKWSTSAFESRLKATKWYRDRSEAQRQFDRDMYDDPADLKRRKAILRATLSQTAKRLGVSPTQAQLDQWARIGLRNGWTDAEINAQMAKLVNIKNGSADQTLTGQVGQAYDDLTKLSTAYGVPTTGSRLDSQITDVIAGNKSVDDFNDYYRELAKKHYAGVADLLDKGMTTMDILDPYLRNAADDLGLTAAQMMQTGADGYLDPKWTAAIQGPQAMTMDEWRRKIREDQQYGWASTTKAKTQAASVGARIANLFGA